MNKIDYKEQVLSTDVLVIGGGIAGLTAAITVKETNANTEVLIVEKQTSGYSGKANRGGGVLQYFDFNRVKPIEFVAYHANAVGCFLGDQVQMLNYVSRNHEMIDKLIEWGVKVPYNEDGSLKIIPTGPMTGMIGVDLDITLKVRRTAEKKGVKIIDKVTISDILTNEGQAAGAVGYSILDGTFYIIKAKAVILATGSQNYRVINMWSNGRGDGIAAAYRAGAEMRNAEFGNFAQLFKVKSHHELVFNENCLYNALDENITKNFRWFPEADINSNAIAEWYNQMSAGKGPIYMRPDECPMTKDDEVLFTTDLIWSRPYGLKLWKTIYEKCHSVDTDNEVAPGFLGEQSPVKVNHDMETTVPRLFAIGDVSYAGSAAAGAVPAPPGRNRGSGILNAVFAGLIAGEKSVQYAEKSEQLKLCENQINECRERAFAPLYREEGYTAKEVIQDLQAIIAPVENSIYMSEHRLSIALRKLEKVKSKAAQLKAEDFHYLLSCHEAEAMILSAEMFFKASLLRKESRGWFLREDYPNIDNENWLKWITVKNVNGEMTFGTEDIPIESYPIKPPTYKTV
ncbi:FAD-dependent oxidoreductase [Clostridium sp. SYSU_GA19001]|uniref:FAD-dependent oxidoreductase n=1 Tax=Clostridium caldaquaticum TaxID=2940653 RepID=UPI0020776872|nr:FAD-dependent oxidoreductase [Clostridium caldaquaticum]MCM8711222.1 FAD-dependent oxidoreductase [Clostridium caldaquaticum]